MSDTPGAKKRRLTPKEEKFVEAVIETGCAGQAARLAFDISPDAHPNTPYSIGSEYIRKPRVAEAIADRRRDLLAKMRAKAEDALRVLYELIDNPDTPATTRLAAVRDLLDRVGLAAEKRLHIEGNLSHQHTAQVLERARRIAAERRLKASEPQG